MPSLHLFSVAIAVFAFGSCLRRTLDVEASEPENVIKVSADDLNSGKVVVIGRLGAPLKTMQTVRGTWQRPDGVRKDNELRFHITHVNGEALREPVIFYRALVDVRYPLRRDAAGRVVAQEGEGPTPSTGQTWEIRAYETGGFSGTPDEYNAELGTYLNSQVQAAVWSREFQVELHGIMQRPVARAKDNGRGKSRDGKQTKP